jgi:hypothetical protein
LPIGARAGERGVGERQHDGILELGRQHAAAFRPGRIVVSGFLPGRAEVGSALLVTPDVRQREEFDRLCEDLRRQKSASQEEGSHSPSEADGIRGVHGPSSTTVSGRREALSQAKGGCAPDKLKLELQRTFRLALEAHPITL